jgi:hypothetical protein
MFSTLLSGLLAFLPVQHSFRVGSDKSLRIIKGTSSAGTEYHMLLVTLVSRVLGILMLGQPTNPRHTVSSAPLPDCFLSQVSSRVRNTTF